MGENRFWMQRMTRFGMAMTWLGLSWAGPLLFTGCQKSPAPDPVAALWEKITAQPARDLARHGDGLSKPLAARFMPAPPWLLDTLRAADERWDYGSRPLTAAETKQFADAVKRLPTPWVPILEKHLVAVYGVENYWGGGYTEFLPQRDGTINSYMVVNLASLGRDISTWMSLKEESAFKREGKPLRIIVDGGTQLTGLDYVFLHESGHVVDYATAKTPWVEGDVKTLFRRGDEPTPFTKGVWSNDKMVGGPHEFEYRGKAVAYGFKGAPTLSIEKAPAFYASLSRSPFVSAYASQSWAEDFADYCAFRIIEKIIGRPITVTVVEGDQPVYSYAPTAGPLVRLRMSSVPEIP